MARKSKPPVNTELPMELTPPPIAPRAPSTDEQEGQAYTDAAGRSTGRANKRQKKEDKQAQQKFDDFMAEARRRFHSVADDPGEIENRRLAAIDTRFYNGDQWEDGVRKRLEGRRRPVLTINRVKPAVRQVTNTQRQNRPSLAVYPVDDRADIKTARILSGTIKHIQTNSMADIAYDDASNSQVIHGRGYLRAVIDYATPMSFDQEVYIESIEDSFSVYCGPVRNSNYLDMPYAFIARDLSPDEYEAEFGKDKSQFSGLQDFTSVGNQAKGWGTRHTIRVAEYYERRMRNAVIVKLSDGNVLEKDKIPEALLDSLQIIDERTTQIPKVYWCVINGVEKLDETEIPGYYIPIIPVIGDKQIVDGVTFFSGIIRSAIDPQRQYNYFRSKMTETVALAPTAPWVMAEGQDEGHEKEWDMANIDNYAVLRYKPKDVSGKLAPPPQRQTFEPPIQALVMAGAQYEEDLKATTQVYDTKLGGQSNEVSGRAQQLRINQSDTGNYNYTDNFNRSLRHLGKVLLGIIPVIYDAKSLARIIGEDELPDQVNIINNPAKPAYSEETISDTEIKKVYNIGVGEYDVMIGVGPSYMNKRQEAFDMLTKLVNSFPSLMEIAGDKVLANSDIPGAQEIAARIKKVIEKVHPEIMEDAKNSLPPKAKQAIDQMMQMIDSLKQAVEQRDEIIKTKQVEQQGKVEIAKMQFASDRLSDDVKLMLGHLAAKQKETADSLAAFGSQMDQFISGIQTQQEQAHQRELQSMQQAHEAALQGMQHTQEQTLQANEPKPAAGGEVQ